MIDPGTLAGEAPTPTDEHYVHATRPRESEITCVLKQGDTFALLDRGADISPGGSGDQGLFHEGTRFLSRYQLRMNGERPALLSSAVVDDNAMLAVDLTNLDLERDGRLLVPSGTVHVFRSKFLWNGCCFERLRLHNFGEQPVDASFEWEFEADYRDIFEVRGSRRPRRGALQPPAVGDGEVALSYLGLDRVARRTRLTFTPRPAQLTGRHARFLLRLEPNETQELHVSIACESGEERLPTPRYGEALCRTRQALAEAEREECRVHTSNELFDRWLERSAADLRILVSRTAQGPYPFAGVPWYSTVFGRDGLLTALQALWVRPELARGVLRFLAHTQAAAFDPERDAEPGKIVHEMRRGEMAALREIPFGLYYGTIDATPLFVVLAGAYWEATGDRALVQELWPSVERALLWCDTYGDRDEDGFVEYGMRARSGLRNQGWKDSWDAIFHADGRLAEPSITLCEVQAYVYGARRAGALLARVMGEGARALELDGQAERLRERFERAFWLEELGTYALALDGEKQPCRVRASNAGQCLFTGIAAPDRARRVAELLRTPAFASGWGVRTVAEGEARFNPMSYHNGSIWPHDNALIALGLARYGLKAGVVELTEALFEASGYFEMARMPELYCGFVRRRFEGPTLYPVACSPQAWAAGSVLMLLQACLGMQPDAPHRRLRFLDPVLPGFLDEIRLRGLRVGDVTVDLGIHRLPGGATVDVERRTGELEVTVVK